MNINDKDIIGNINKINDEKFNALLKKAISKYLEEEFFKDIDTMSNEDAIELSDELKHAISKMIQNLLY